MQARFLFLATMFFAAAAAAQSAARTQAPDVIYVPTPYEVVDEMLKLAGVKKGDVLYDLGSGDAPTRRARHFRTALPSLCCAC